METRDLKMFAIKHEINPLEMSKDSLVTPLELKEEQTFSNRFCKTFHVSDKNKAWIKPDDNRKLKDEWCHKTDIPSENRGIKTDKELGSNVNFNVRVLVEDCLKTNWLSGQNLKTSSNQVAIRSATATISSSTNYNIFDRNSSGEESLVTHRRNKTALVDRDSFNRKHCFNDSTNKLINTNESVLTIGGNCAEELQTNRSFGQPLRKMQSSAHSGRFPSCDICFISLGDKDEYMIHLRTHEEYKFKCANCPKAFKKRINFWRHNKHFHNTLYIRPEHGDHVQTQKSIQSDTKIRRNQKFHSCDVCLESFENIDTFRLHLRTHSEYEYKCNECLNAYKVKDNLTRHEKTHNPLFVCERCGKRFPTIYQLEGHKIVHTGIKNFLCDICKRYFPSKSSLRVHIQLHLSDTYSCPYCVLYFREDNILKDHIKRAHSKDRVCVLCEQVFKTNKNLLEHLKSHAEGTFKCSDCCRCYRKESSLRSHKRVHSRYITCKICNKSFSTLSNLKIHKTVHNKHRDFQCEICHKCFKGEHALKTHLRNVHTSLKRFTCSLCPVSVKTSGGLRHHISSVHTEKRFICNLCEAEFSTKACLFKHIKHIHINVEYSPCKICLKLIKAEKMKDHILIHFPEKRRKLTCNECGKQFTSKWSLRNHLDFHAGIRRHECKECGARFTQKSHLNTHSVLHSDSLPFICNECGRSFQTKSQMIDHCLVHKNEKTFACNVCDKNYNTRPSLLWHIRFSHKGKQN